MQTVFGLFGFLLPFSDTAPNRFRRCITMQQGRHRRHEQSAIAGLSWDQSAQPSFRLSVRRFAVSLGASTRYNPLQPSICTTDRRKVKKRLPFTRNACESTKAILPQKAEKRNTPEVAGRLQEKKGSGILGLGIQGHFSSASYGFYEGCPYGFHAGLLGCRV